MKPEDTMRERVENHRLEEIRKHGVDFTCEDCKKEYARTQYGRGFTNGKIFCEYCADQLEDEPWSENDGDCAGDNDNDNDDDNDNDNDSDCDSDNVIF